MMKWLRVHTKQIMVVVVLLAMFSFVGGSALYNLWAPDPSKEVVMKVFGREVKQGELNVAKGDTELLRRLFVQWKYDPKGEMNLRHWFMLAEEAERAGVVVTDKEVDSLIDQMDRFRQQRKLGSLDQLRIQGKISRSMIEQAVRRHLAIQKYAGLVVRAATPSEPQVRHYVRDTQAKVKVQYVALDAKRFVDKDEAIPEEELEARFEKYKDVDPAEDEMGEGYRYPDRVKVQYVVASASKIEPEVKVSLEEIKTYWKTNKSKFKKTVYVEPPAPPPGTSQPAEKPKPIPQQKMKTFSEARPDVERVLRKSKALKMARQAVIKLADEMARPWNEERADPSTGYKPIPPGVDGPLYMKTASDRIAQRFGITLDYGETGLLSRQQLGSHYLLRGAVTPGEGDEPLELADYAFRVPLFYKVDRSRETSLRLQLYQVPNVPLTIAGRSQGYTIVGGRLVPKPGEPESFVLFRVVQASEAQAPASLAEIRGRVEQDVRIERAFDRMATTAKEFYGVAKRLGLEAALQRFDDLRQKYGVTSVAKPAPFPRAVRRSGKDLGEALLAGKTALVTATVPGLGASQAFIDACFAMTAEDWSPPAVEVPQTERVKAATTQPAADPAPKVQLLPVRRMKKWFVIQMDESQPVDLSQYQTRYRSAASAALLRDRATVLSNLWFDPKDIERRCGYLDVRAGSAAPVSPQSIKTKAPPQPIRF